jgi:hypothetical protein
MSTYFRRCFDEFVAEFVLRVSHAESQFTVCTAAKTEALPIGCQHHIVTAGSYQHTHSTRVRVVPEATGIEADGVLTQILLSYQAAHTAIHILYFT